MLEIHSGRGHFPRKHTISAWKVCDFLFFSPPQMAPSPGGKHTSTPRPSADKERYQGQQDCWQPLTPWTFWSKVGWFFFPSPDEWDLHDIPGKKSHSYDSYDFPGKIPPFRKKEIYTSDSNGWVFHHVIVPAVFHSWEQSHTPSRKTLLSRYSVAESLLVGGCFMEEIRRSPVEGTVVYLPWFTWFGIHPNGGEGLGISGCHQRRGRFLSFFGAAICCTKMHRFSCSGGSQCAFRFGTNPGFRVENRFSTSLIEKLSN